MAEDDRLGTWVGGAVSLFLVAGILGALVLHSATTLSWDEIGIAVGAYVGIQLLIFIPMFWARKSAKARQDFRAVTLLVGMYGWVSGLLLMHYAAKWGFMSADGIRGDYRDFSIAMVIVTVLVFVFFPLRYRAVKNRTLS